MFDNYLIELGERAVGILIRTGEAFRFHAVEPAFLALEGVTFPDAFAAERAALRVARRRKAR
jgi:hypothetical protein